MEAGMTDSTARAKQRRQFLKTAGSAALAMPFAGIAGCSGEDSSGPPTAPEAPAPASQPSAAPQAAAPEPLRLQLADAQAKALAYVHDASMVDTATQPRYEVGQECRNCALFQGSATDEWANCSIFPGRQVKATGWCNVYAPKAS